MESSDDDPSVLRKRVASPGGTTAEALAVMDQGGFVQVVRDAVAAATERSVELGEIAAGS